ncbi:ABC transporter ATP-binding protein [Nocardia acidivorans]|uniref:ABC transporter ATP-binding protein n=1 Tax=Nocardia acidivorans TaxID=404580 RepID=UPI00082E9B35|nr:ATP-binding cassette domain-containing protein [Nocardia acidivorans]
MTSRSAPPVVVCAGVARVFGTGATAITAITDVNCSVPSGAHIALTGPSGSGKSTLLHVMAGLETATSGTVCWPGLDEAPRARPGLIGVVFQGPSLLPALDVMENVAVPLLLGGTPERDATERAAAALDLLGIGEFARQLPHELSGGQAQRVAVARVLAAAPRLILADEPTGQIDHEAAAVVLDVLVRTATELGAALVISTHDPLIADGLPLRWTMHHGALQDNPAGVSGGHR